MAFVCRIYLPWCTFLVSFLTFSFSGLSHFLTLSGPLSHSVTFSLPLSHCHFLTFSLYRFSLSININFSPIQPHPLKLNFPLPNPQIAFSAQTDQNQNHPNISPIPQFSPSSTAFFRAHISSNLFMQNRVTTTFFPPCLLSPF